MRFGRLAGSVRAFGSPGTRTSAKTTKAKDPVKLNSGMIASGCQPAYTPATGRRQAGEEGREEGHDQPWIHGVRLPGLPYWKSLS